MCYTWFDKSNFEKHILWLQLYAWLYFLNIYSKYNQLMIIEYIIIRLLRFSTKYLETE